MAAQRGIQFQEKVSRLLSRQNGKPVLKPNRTLALKDAVANRKLKKGGMLKNCTAVWSLRGFQIVTTHLDWSILWRLTPIRSAAEAQGTLARQQHDVQLDTCPHTDTQYKINRSQSHYTLIYTIFYILVFINRYCFGLFVLSNTKHIQNPVNLVFPWSRVVLALR